MKFLTNTNNTTNHSNNSPSNGILGSQTYKRKGRKMTSLNSKPDMINQYNIAQQGRKSLVYEE
jgi:hypothetical protein